MDMLFLFLAASGICTVLMLVVSFIEADKQYLQAHQERKELRGAHSKLGRLGDGSGPCT